MAQFFTAPAEELEGNYTTWTWKWTNDIPDGISSWENISVHLDDETNVITLMWWDGSADNRFGIYNIADFSVVFESPPGSSYTSSCPYDEFTLVLLRGFIEMYGGGGSISLKKYILLLREGDDAIEVWRGGASALWSHDTSIDEAGTYIRAGIISLTGKYVLVQTHSGKLILYEGS